MAFKSVSSNNSNSQNWMQVNDLARDIKSKERTTIYKDDAGTRRVLEGKGKNGFYGFKVSPADVDVYDATDDQLIFNSNQNVFKIVNIGTVTLPTYTVTRAAGWTHSSVAIPPNATVAHGVTTGTPLVSAYLRVTGPGGLTLLALPYTAFGVIGGAAYFHTISLAVNETYLEISESTITNGDVGVLTHGGTTIEYWILQETATQ